MVYDPTPWDDKEGLGKTQVKGVAQFHFAARAGEPTYEIVLGETNAKQFEADMERWRQFARPTGLKMPPLPAELRAEFPGAGQLNLSLPHPGPSPATAKKTAAPSTRAKKKEEYDRTLPGGGEAPTDFWVKPKPPVPWKVVQDFKRLRERIYRDLGQPMRQGALPRELGYEWARRHPDAVREWVNRYPELYVGRT